MNGIEIDGARQADRFVMTGFSRSRQARPVLRRSFIAAPGLCQDGDDDDGARRRLRFQNMSRSAGATAPACVLFIRQSGFPAVFLTIEHLNRLARHNGGNGVFIDELRVPVTTQKYTEVVEGGYNTRQLNTIDQKYC